MASRTDIHPDIPSVKTVHELPDAVYVYIKKDVSKHKETKELFPGVYADFDTDGKLIGIEFTEAVEVSVETVTAEEKK